MDCGLVISVGGPASWRMRANHFVHHCFVIFSSLCFSANEDWMLSGLTSSAILYSDCLRMLAADRPSCSCRRFCGAADAVFSSCAVRDDALLAPVQNHLSKYNDPRWMQNWRYTTDRPIQSTGSDIYMYIWMCGREINLAQIILL